MSRELRLETGGVKIAVSKSGSLGTHTTPAPTVTLPLPAATSAQAPVPLAASSPVAASLLAVAAAVELAPGQVYLRAPSLGVVWSRPKPGAPSFIEEGQLIEVGMTVCLIEVMKLFTQMDSNVRGKVVRCLVTDGEMVEHDTPIFIVEVA